MNNEVKTINGYDIKDAKAVRTYDSVALLKTDRKLKQGQHVKTRGYYSINDGGSAEYYITSTQSESDYQENLENGLYATLIVNDAVNIKQLGGKSELNFDNKNIIDLAIQYYDKIIISDGDYYVSNYITLKSNLIISGINAKIYSDSPYVFNGTNLSNLLIKNIKLESTVDTSNTAHMSESETDERGYTTLSSIVHIYNSSNVTLNNCVIKGSFTGVYIHKTNNVIIKNCECLLSSSKIICLSESHFKLINNYIHDVDIYEDEAYPCYLFQATDDSTIINQEQSIISNNRFENNPNWDAIMSHRYNKISIVNNSIKNVRSGIDLSASTPTVENGNIIVSDNYIEGTNTDRWNASALNQGIIITGNDYLTNIIISNNIIKNFGKFLSANGGVGLYINNISKIQLSNNIIEMDTTVNTVASAIYLRGNIDDINVCYNIINSKSLLPILLYNLTSINCSITNNIINSTFSTGVNIDTSNSINLTNALINNISNLTYGMRVKSGDVMNGITYSSNNLYPTFIKKIKSTCEISEFTIPANSKTQKFINKSDIGYSGYFNNRSIYTVSPIGSINSNVVITAQHGDSSNIRVEFINTSSSDVTISTTSYNVVIEM